MDTLTTRIVTTQDQRLTDSDELVIFDGPSELNFIVPASTGNGQQAILKNVSEHNVNVHAIGLRDLDVPRLAGGKVKILSPHDSLHLIGYAAGK